MRKKRLVLLLISISSLICCLVLLCVFVVRRGSSSPPDLYINGAQALRLTYSWDGAEADSWGPLECEYDAEHTASARSWKPIRLRNKPWLGLRYRTAVEYYWIEDTQYPEDDPERYFDEPCLIVASWAPMGILLAPPITGRCIADIEVSYWGLSGSGIVYYGILIDVN